MKTKKSLAKFVIDFHIVILQTGLNFTKLLRPICKIFVTLGLKFFRLFRLQVLFEADII
jgi:hypothetical protein